MLYLVATPIGNLGDMSARGLECLRAASMIACEDTRRTWSLLSAFGIPRPEMVSYRQGNEERAGEKVIEALRARRDVVLCSDGGWPSVSDPGYRLVRSCAKEGLAMEVIPGASAVLATLVLSALPTNSWTFKGFPPRQNGALHNFFAMEKDSPHTLVLFESPFRTAKTLAAALDVLGDRECAVCLEISKIHEKTNRGWLSDIAKYYADHPPKGEIAIAIAGNNPKFMRTADGKETAE